MADEDPNFFKDWMDEHRLKASDVCGPLRKSEQTIHQWRSYGVPSRMVPHVQAFMAEWKDPADVAAIPEDLRLEAFVMKPSEDEFDAWNRAAMSKSMTIREWIRDTLETAAADFVITGALPGETVIVEAKSFPVLSIADDPAENLASIELPFLGAVAAGEPVEAPRDEEVTVAKKFPAGHFVVEVNGRSMEPDFPDGSRWVIDGRDKFSPKNGAVCVVSDGSGSYLKRWNARRKVFESINPDFRDVIPADEAKLQGYPVERIS